jgi:hypothetical protein
MDNLEQEDSLCQRITRSTSTTSIDHVTFLFSQMESEYGVVNIDANVVDYIKGPCRVETLLPSHAPPLFLLYITFTRIEDLIKTTVQLAKDRSWYSFRFREWLIFAYISRHNMISFLEILGGWIC